MSSFRRLVLLSLLASAFAFAQTGQGIIVGTVTDSTGAILPNVTVRAVNTQTGFAYSSQSNDEGLYPLCKSRNL